MLLFWAWDSSDWTEAVGADPQPDARRTSAGSGGKHYDRLGEDYWMAREAYLTTENEAPEEPILDAEVPPDQALVQSDAAVRRITAQIDALESQLKIALQSVSEATDRAQKQEIAQHAMRLSLDISKLRAQYYERARTLTFF